LEVTDTGCGIAEDARLKIFDPFYTTKALGRGLGLSAVQGIVRSLGGTIRVQSTLGGGASFEVLLPAWRPTDAP
jgi:signal transduction histidine kinase